MPKKNRNKSIPTTIDSELDALEDALARDFAENAPRELIESQLRSVGIDPSSLTSRSRELVRGKQELRPSWKSRAREQLSAVRSKVRSSAQRYADMSRAQLLDRLETLRNHTSLSAPVTAAFRKRGPAEASDDELRAILGDIEALIMIAGEPDNAPGDGND